MTSIGGDAFGGCSSLTAIEIPNSVMSIGVRAFHGCSSLKSITIPDGVTNIGVQEFAGCDSLESIMIPNGVTNIGYQAFGWCYSLQSITIPDSVSTIGYEAFSYCYSLTSVTMPDGVTIINWSDSVPGKLFLACPLLTVCVKPRAGTTDVVVEIPNGVDATKVTVVVAPDVKTVTPNGAAVRVVRGEADITDFLDLPTAVGGVIDLGAATVKPEFSNEPLDVTKGAKIDLSTPTPQLSTSPTRKGLAYRLKEGATLGEMAADADGDSKVGDGQPWTPKVTVKGGASGFYSIRVSK